MLPYLPVRGGQQPQHFKTRSQEAEKVLGLLPGTNWSHMGRLGPGSGLERRAGGRRRASRAEAKPTGPG